MKQFINPLLRTASVIMLLYIIYNQHQTIKALSTSKPNVDSLTHVCDSLQNELSIMNSEEIE